MAEISLERKHVYKELKNLTDIIGKLSLPNDLSNLKMHAAPPEIIGKITKRAEKENPELFNQLIGKFIRDYMSKGSPKIFGKTEEYYQYNPEKMNPLNLLCLILMCWGRVDDTNLFCSYHELSDALEDYGYKEIASYLRKHYIVQGTLYENIYRMFS